MRVDRTALGGNSTVEHVVSMQQSAVSAPDRATGPTARPPGGGPVRRRSATVTVCLVAALSVSMTGCGGDATRDYAGVCIDRTTQRRVPDGECTGTGSTGNHGWVYYRSGSRVPAVGADAGDGLAGVPGGSGVSRGGVSADGGVSRGGFGAHGGGEVGG